MSMAIGSKLQLEPGSWLEALYEVSAGFFVGVRHSAYMGSRSVYVTFLMPILNAFGLKLNPYESTKHNAGEKTFKVVGVGYGRTGTYSLKLALEELGLPTFHTQHMYEYDEIIGMWTDEVFAPSMQAKKPLMGNPNLQLIADSGFQATVDFPTSLYYEKVMEEYPDCKFILTTREDPQIWFRSWDTLTKSIVQPAAVGVDILTFVKQLSLYFRWLFSIVNKDASYMDAPLPLPDQLKEPCIASYEEHNKRVREKIPKERLLEFSVKQGWEPLCEFLEVSDCPQTPFPKTNSARSVQVQAISSFIVPLVVVLFVLFYAFAMAFQGLTGKTVMGWASHKSRELQLTLRRIFLGEPFWHSPGCLKKA